MDGQPPSCFFIMPNRMLKHTLYALLLSIIIIGSCQVSAQQKIRADVQTKVLSKGKSITVEKSIFYQTNGAMVVHYAKPQEYFMLTNSLGEAKIYMPSRNEVMVMNDKIFSSQNELIYVFLSNAYLDLGLSDLGFQLKGQEQKGKRLIKTFTTNRKDLKNVGKIELAFEAGLPICCIYYDSKNNITRKIYYSAYSYQKQFTLPTRITEISYTAEKDSVVRRELYSNIQTANFSQPTFFDYTIPNSAKLVSLPKK